MVASIDHERFVITWPRDACWLLNVKMAQTTPNAHCGEAYIALGPIHENSARPDLSSAAWLQCVQENRTPEYFRSINCKTATNYNLKCYMQPFLTELMTVWKVWIECTSHCVPFRMAILLRGAAYHNFASHAFQHDFNDSNVYATTMRHCTRRPSTSTTDNPTIIQQHVANATV